MLNSHVEITQRLLDQYQPGKDAKIVLSHLGIGLMRNETSDITLLSEILYDAFAQSRLVGKPQNPHIEIKDPGFLLRELIYRYIKDVLGSQFITQSSALFDQAKSFRQLSSRVESDMRSIERDKSFQAMYRDGDKTLQDQDQLLRDVYLMGDAKRLLHDIGGLKIRDLYLINIQVVGGAERNKNNRFNSPMFDEINKRIDEAQSSVEKMSTKELSVRLLRSFGNTNQVNTDVERPSYGTTTIYAYAPIIIDRVMNGWSFDNKPTMDKFSEDMTNASLKLRGIKARFDRLQVSCEP